MQKPIVQSIITDFYLWDLETTDTSLPVHKSSILHGITDHLVEKIFTIPRGDTKTLTKDCQLYLKEFTKLIPNLNIQSSAFIPEIQAQFNLYHSQLDTEKVDFSNTLLNKVKTAYKIAGTIPKLFVKDLDLLTEEALFIEKMMNASNLTQNFVFSEYKARFKEFITGYNPIIEDFLKKATTSLIEKFEDLKKHLFSTIKNKILSFLNDLLNSLEYQSILLKNIEILEESDTRPVSWNTVYQEIYVKEPIKLSQVLKLSNGLLLITIVLEKLDRLQVIVYENFVAKSLKLFKSKNILIAVGSVPESLVLIENSTRSCWIARLLNRKLKIIEKVHLFKDKVIEITSVCYVKSKHLIIYIYAPGAVDHIIINNKPYKFFNEFIYPKIYFSIVLSECKNFLMFLADDSVYVFNLGMRVVGSFEKILPVQCYLNADKFIVVCNNSGGLSLFSHSVNYNTIAVNKEEGLDYDKIALQTHKTLSLGCDIFKEMFAKNSFSKIAGKTKEPE